MAKQILIVEDDSDVVGYIEHLLKSLGYAVCAVVSSGEAAMQKATEAHPDLALIDMMLAGDMDGIGVAEQMRTRFNIPVVYLNGLCRSTPTETCPDSRAFWLCAQTVR